MFVFGDYIYTKSSKILQAFSYEEAMQCLNIMQLHAKRKKKGYYVGYLTYECGLLLQDSYYGVIKNRSKPSEPILYFELFLKRKKFKKKIKNKNFIAHKKQLFDIIKPLDKMRYEKDFRDIKKNIKAGHTYQVNYTQEIILKPLLSLDSFTYFKLLATRQSTQYKAYITNKYVQILSFSPELFFHFSNHKITAQPMKGTIGRALFHTNNKQREREAKLHTKHNWNLYKKYRKIKKIKNVDRLNDFNNIKTLHYDSKNRSENVMIVDLLRNDLSRIAKQGSVRVKELFGIKTYKTLHQMVSTIQAKLPPSYGIIEIFQALFPCGSITGAPKYKTTEIISELENRNRNVYCGAIGVIGAKETIMNVPIRTLYKHAKEECYHYGVGSGVVWDSNVYEEFDELQLKCKFLTK